MKKRQKTKPDKRSDSDAAAQRWMKRHCKMPSLAELVRLSNEQAALPSEPPKTQGELFDYRPTSWELAELQQR